MDIFFSSFTDEDSEKLRNLYEITQLAGNGAGIVTDTSTPKTHASLSTITISRSPIKTTQWTSQKNIDDGWFWAVLFTKTKTDKSYKTRINNQLTFGPD